MHTQAIGTGTLPLTGILLLILDSRTALAGAREGLTLILHTVIPALFPFFFLSTWLSCSSWDNPGPLLRFMGRLFRIPQGAQQLLIPAFLGGYPAGAHAVASLYNRNRLSKQSAQRLLGYCSNAGPSFLFGILGPMFPGSGWIWLLWGLHTAGALTAAYLLPGANESVPPASEEGSVSLQKVLEKSLRSMALVCGWIFLFRIMITFLNKWTAGLFHPEFRVLLSGLLELTNGCSLLLSVSDVRVRFLLGSLLISAGGLCVTAQTRTVTQGLELRYYLIGKAIQTVFCLCAGAALLFKLWYFLAVPAGMFLLLSVRREKTSRFPETSGV